ncbi:hypothetical protein [Ralstonia pseudosolanacearum]
MNIKRKQKIILFGAVSQMLCIQALAQGVSTQTSTTVPSLATSSPDIPGLPKLSVMDPNGAPPDCNKEIMQNLNSEYLRNRSNARIMQYNNQMNGLVATTPKSNGMDCFQQAMQNIKNLMNAINSILAMFSGQMDMDSIMQQIVNMVLKAACQEVNQVTGSVSGSLNTATGGLTGAVGGITNTQIGSGSMSTTVGGILNGANSGSTGTTDVLGGSLNSINNTIGSVTNTATNASNTGSGLVNKIQSANPFGSN